MTSTIRWPGSASTARSSSTRWFSTKTCIGSATSEAPRAFSSGWPSESADTQNALRRHWRNTGAYQRGSSRVCEDRVVREAQLKAFGSGLTPVSEGCFVVNVRDAEWWSSDSRGARCAFENEYGVPPVEFTQLGINLTVLEPGQNVLY